MIENCDDVRQVDDNDTRVGRGKRIKRIKTRRDFLVQHFYQKWNREPKNKNDSCFKPIEI